MQSLKLPLILFAGAGFVVWGDSRPEPVPRGEVSRRGRSEPVAQSVADRHTAGRKQDTRWWASVQTAA